MTEILAIWRFLRALPWKSIGTVVLAVTMAISLWRAPWAEHRQKAKDAAAWQAEHARAEGFKANQIALTDALTHQNAAVVALRTEGNKRVSDGKNALKAAVQANQGLADQAAALRRSAGRKVGVNDPCVISNTLGNMGGV